MDTYAKVSPSDTLRSKDPRMSAVPGDPKIMVSGQCLCVCVCCVFVCVCVGVDVGVGVFVQ